MVTMKVRQWVVIDDVHHIKTSWQIATDKEFENLVAESKESEENITAWDSGVSVPLDGVLWGRVNRHFDDDTTSGWSEPRKLLNISNHNSILLLNEVTVERPILTVDKLDVVGDSKTITVNTTKFKCTNDGHFSTHWIVTNRNGDVLYKNLEDVENKDSITINKSEFVLEPTRYDTLIFSAIHKSGSGVESSVGQLVIDTGSFNFEFAYKMKRVIPMNTYTIKFKKIDTDKPHRIDMIKLVRASDDAVVYVIDVKDDTMKFDIPGSLLIGDSKYYVDVYAIDNSAIMNRKRATLKTLQDLTSMGIDKSHNYENVFKYITSFDNRKIPKGLVTDEMYNGQILLPKDKQLKTIEFDIVERVFREVGDMKGISLLSDNNDYGMVKRYQDKIIIDTLNNDGYPTFMVYDHNQFTDMSTLQFSTVRESETYCIGRTNAWTIIEDELFYVPVQTTELFKLSLITGEVTKVKDIEVRKADTVAMIDLKNGKLLFIGGKSVFGTIYDTKEDHFYSRYDIPVKFRSRELKTVELINGDVVIYRTTVKEDDSVGDVLILDYNTKQMKEQEFTAEPMGIETTIKLSSGDVVFFDYEEEKELLYLFN